MLATVSSHFQAAAHRAAPIRETTGISQPSREVMDEVVRMRPLTILTNPCDGIVVWSPVKSLWFTAHALVALVGGSLTFQWDAAAFSCALTVFTLCLGHSIGLHRLLIHPASSAIAGSNTLVHLGTVVGMEDRFDAVRARYSRLVAVPRRVPCILY